MNKLFKFIKRPLGIVLTIFIVGGGIYVYFLIKKEKPAPQTITAQKGIIVQEVTVTGKTQPAESVDLSFEKSGKISRVNVGVGDNVFSGQLLAEIDSSELLAQLKQNEAALQVQKAKLDELKRGSRPEEIRVKQTELEKEQQNLANDYAGVADILNDSYAKADDAVRTKTDAFFTDDDSANPILTFLGDYQLGIDVKSLRVLSGDDLEEWKTELNIINLNSSFASLEQAIQNGKNHLSVIRDFLSKAFDILNKTNNLSATTLETYKANINTARTNVNAAYSNVSDQEQTISAQKMTVNKIQDELNLMLAGSDPEEIAAQEAQVKQAEAAVQLAKTQINKNVLRSPIDGVVSEQDAKIGQIASANETLVSIISKNKLEVEANIPEADIAKVKIGNPAEITLDAYGNDVVFEAKVVSIDPAETIIEGVATYKTKLQFIKEDERVKPGMTANIDILTDKRENVIVIPQRAVIDKNGEKIVNLLSDDGAIKEVKVETGLRGSDGNVEITSGIKEGEKVIISAEQK